MKRFLLGIFFIFALALPVVAVSTPAMAAPAPARAGGCEARLLGIPPWYRGLTGSAPDCALKSPADVGGISKYIWTIVLNIVEMALVLAVYLTVGFIIYGGFLFMTGGYNPSQIQNARKTILNAVIGMAICLGAIALTNLAFSIIT